MASRGTLSDALEDFVQVEMAGHRSVLRGLLRKLVLPLRRCLLMGSWRDWVDIRCWIAEAGEGGRLMAIAQDSQTSSTKRCVPVGDMSIHALSLTSYESSWFSVKPNPQESRWLSLRSSVLVKFVVELEAPASLAATISLQ